MNFYYEVIILQIYNPITEYYYTFQASEVNN